LREAHWVMDTVKQAVDDSKGDGAVFKAAMRKAHAERLRQEAGLVVEPVTYDPPEPQDENSALTYHDPTGRPLAPVLPPAPIEGPDVSLKAAQERVSRGSDASPVRDRRNRPWVLGNQGRVHTLLAAHAMIKIEKLY